ncbi:hypothetical protein FAI41_03420 [Acetobacteraceae bacterium]|nr:hypothetical protein FAI41_03420 [Acetobacteraceae bacterium]
MKWFFAVTQDMIFNEPIAGTTADFGFADCVRVAVQSAKENTSLLPHMIFDGEPCSFTKEMEMAGVKVIFHRLHWYDRLKETQNLQKPEWKHYMSKAAGAFMRLELPLLEQEDQYVLYTDYDVLFAKDFDLSFCKPEIFAAGGQFWQHDYYNDMNAGVMVLNVERIRHDLPALIEFMCDNFTHISGYDQELLRIFYGKNWMPLSPKFNWKPYWGINDQAQIIHFYGPKPLLAHKFLENPNYNNRQIFFHNWSHLFHQNPEGYSYYVRQWEEYLHKANSQQQNPEIAAFDAVRA